MTDPIPSPYSGSIPSPFMGHVEMPEGMLDQIEDILKDNGFTEYMVSCAKPVPNDPGSSMWAGGSNVISEGMIAYLEEAIRYMKQSIKEEQDNGGD